jgi:hypothetical protein
MDAYPERKGVRPVDVGAYPVEVDAYPEGTRAHLVEVDA